MLSLSLQVVGKTIPEELVLQVASLFSKAAAGVLL